MSLKSYIEPQKWTPDKNDPHILELMKLGLVANVKHFIFLQQFKWIPFDDDKIKATKQDYMRCFESANRAFMALRGFDEWGYYL